ncbi:type II toxin-antitoxin system RelE/ParE family toxin [Pseudothauera hydrothermalis]|uniref:type II toxin-antitoxin system RelE/ParE family toxin n=1 Tax=Pseudothauera hydrothermalis TaxID=2184083 RepID=UPI000E0967E1|nr:type II toxin-antitoxin system RelE/ParE family toxin [Pseudothauera hydrothermalis]
MKPIVPREQALRDIDDAIAYCLREGGEAPAPNFIDALERAYAHIRAHPATGSPRYAHELDLPGVRAWLLDRYLYAVFYVERPDHIDVWRVLHTRHDIPAWLLEQPGE